MEKYVLTQDLVTGNELIDSEHRKIFDEVNTLLDACSKGKGRENLSSLGEFLVEYVTKHFSDEEDLQKRRDARGHDEGRQEGYLIGQEERERRDQ